MKVASLSLLWLFSASGAHGSEANPLGTVLALLDDLAAKVTKEGEAEAKAYNDYVEWCDETTQNAGFAIDTATKQKAKLEATIAELSSQIETSASKIEDLGSAIAAAEKEVSDATVVREKEASDFATTQKELVDTVDALSRAVGILEKEMAKNPAAFAQVASAQLTSALDAFSAVLDAAAFSTQDQKKLAALLQSQQESGEGDDEGLGSPAGAVYKTHSTNILDVLEDLKEKAEGELSDVRKAESNTKHNFELLKQSLEDQVAADTRHKNEEKSAKSAAEGAKTGAQSDLEVTAKELANAQQQKATAQSTCLQVAADHEATVAGRKEELRVIAEARGIIAETTSGAVSQTYSFMQLVSASRTAGGEVADLIKRLAKQEHSSALAQLASRISAVARYGASNGEDPFAKIKGLIQDMIARLEHEAESEATEKAYCDEQLAKTEFKKGELEDDIAKMTSTIDQAAARSAELKAQVKELEAELGALAKTQAEMDKIRSETNADYKQAKADLELGLAGVRKALSVLREYYGAAAMLQSDQPALPVKHSKAAGAGGSIIDILEVVESDFATNLAKEESEEADAQSEYEKVSQENAVTKTMKTQDVKYKSQESKAQDATVAEYSADRDTANSELSAVLDYYGKIKERCIAKPETYEERKRRREAEIKGLREALSILEDETALVQRKRRGAFRGAIQ